jgi:hypothetical protein
MREKQAATIDSLLRMSTAAAVATLRADFENWSDDGTIVRGFWSALAEVIAENRIGTPVREEALRILEKANAHVGSDAEAFIRRVQAARDPTCIRALAILADRPKAARALSDLARDGSLDVACRVAAVQALSNSRETPMLLRLVTSLAQDDRIREDALQVLDAFHSRRSSPTEALMDAFTPGAELRDAGIVVRIEEVLELGMVRFRHPTIVAWDPIEVDEGPIATLKVPASRCDVTAARSGGQVRALRLQFGKRRVARWRRGPSFASGYGQCIISDRHALKEVRSADYSVSFWDDVLDKELEGTDDEVAVLVLDGGDELIVWSDKQLGVAAWWGLDGTGLPVCVLLDGIRRTLNADEGR